jgi:hypothetical protein
MVQLLTPDYRLALAGALQCAYPNVAELSRFLIGLGHKSTDEFAQGALPEIIDRIIANYEAGGRVGLARFLEKCASQKTNADLAGIAEGILADLPPPPSFEKHEHRDPCQALFPRDEPFLDRDHIRLQIGSLRTKTALRTLMLDGESPSGKSHTYELIRHIARTVPPFRYLYIDLRANARKRYDAGLLMKAIKNLMKLDAPGYPETGQAQNTVWVQELCDWFIGALNDRDEYWWLVIDGISQGEIAADVRELIGGLVAAAEQNTDLLRLVLLGCVDEAIGKSGSKVAIESIAPPGRSEIEKFIRLACIRAKRTISDADVERTVAVVMNELPADPVQRLREIARRTGLAAKEMVM